MSESGTTYPPKLSEQEYNDIKLDIVCGVYYLEVVIPANFQLSV